MKEEKNKNRKAISARTLANREFSKMFNDLLDFNHIKTNVAAAEMIGVNEKTIRRWRKGEKSPIDRKDTMQMIYKALNYDEFIKRRNQYEHWDKKYNAKKIAFETNVIQMIESYYGFEFGKEDEESYNAFADNLISFLDEETKKYKQ